MTCSSDLFIKIWDVQNEWRNTKTFPGHEHTISSVRFMPGDLQIVSASRDQTIRIFDVASTLVATTVLSLSETKLVGHIQASGTNNQRSHRLGAVRRAFRRRPVDRKLLERPGEYMRLWLNGITDNFASQTARIFDPLSGESKMELRGHEHTIEVVVFAPVAAYAAIRELAGIPVCFGYVIPLVLTSHFKYFRAPSGQIGLQHMPQQAPEIEQSNCGTLRQGNSSVPL